MKVLGAPLAGAELDAFAELSLKLDPSPKILAVPDSPLDPGWCRCADVKPEDGVQDVAPDDAPPTLFEEP